MTESAKEGTTRWLGLLSRKTSTASVTHMGWRFSNGPDVFYALIVDYAATESEAGTILDSISIGIAASPAILSMLTQVNKMGPGGASAA